MTTTFPTALDTLSNPAGADTMSAVTHAGQHTNVDTAIEAIEAKVGIDSSTNPDSHDYLLRPPRAVVLLDADQAGSEETEWSVFRVNEQSGGGSTEELDVGGIHSPTSNQHRITVNREGVWLVTGYLQYAAISSGALPTRVRVGIVHKNSAQVTLERIIHQHGLTEGGQHLTTSMPFYGKVGDYFYMFYYHDGASRTVTVSDARFGAIWLPGS